MTSYERKRNPVRAARGGARDTPILADVSSSETELASSGGQASSDSGSGSSSTRFPLGEIRSNDLGDVANSLPTNLDVPTQSVTTEDEHDAASVEHDSTTGQENTVVLAVCIENDADRSARPKTKKSNKETGTVKRSARKTKSQATEASVEVVEQMRRMLRQNIQATKDRNSTMKRMQTGVTRNSIVAENLASLPHASEEAADILKDQASSDLIKDDQSQAPPALPADTHDMLFSESGKLTDTKMVEANEGGPILPKPKSEATMPVHTEDPSNSRAVQRLAMLFEEQPQSQYRPNDPSPLANIVSRASSGQATNGDALEALDALEDDLEAAEKSVAVARKTQSQKDDIASTASSKVAPAKRSKAGTVTKNSAKPESPSKRTLRNTISPTDVAMALKKGRTVEALNTPEKVKKSTKPPTRATFQLSSEATAAKLKTQREERQKKREEEEKRQGALKAKRATLPAKPAEVRSTAASRARQSLSIVKSLEEEATRKSVGQLTKRISTVGTTDAQGTTRRSSTITTGTSRAPPRSQGPDKEANTIASIKQTIVQSPARGAPRLSTMARSSRLVNSPASRKTLSSTVGRVDRPSVNTMAAKRMSINPNATVSATTAARISTQTGNIDGRDVVNRSKAGRKEEARIAKEKINAVAKARLEASERGKAASKAWAEKKKKQSEDSKVRGTSGEGGPSKEGAKSVPVVDDKMKDEPPMPQHQDLVEKRRSVLAMEILRGDGMQSDDAAFIVAEMHRIEKLRQSASGEGVDLLA